jgi:uncharacterized radical SAM superfamily protein
MKNTSSEICRRMESLLQQQQEALLREDFEAVEDKGAEIMLIAVALSDEQKIQLAPYMEDIRRIHEQMIQILGAKKETTAAELAATRQKRNLNRSYGTRHE